MIRRIAGGLAAPSDGVAELGMTTVLVEPEPSAAGEAEEAEHVHHVTGDLVDWLEDRLASMSSATP